MCSFNFLRFLQKSWHTEYAALVSFSRFQLAQFSYRHFEIFIIQRLDIASSWRHFLNQQRTRTRPTECKRSTELIATPAPCVLGLSVAVSGLSHPECQLFEPDLHVSSEP